MIPGAGIKLACIICKMSIQRHDAKAQQDDTVMQQFKCVFADPDVSSAQELLHQGTGFFQDPPNHQ